MFRVDINAVPGRSILSSPFEIRGDTLKIIEYSFKDLRNGKTKIFQNLIYKLPVYFLPHFPCFTIL
jgi:hypothetical protein